MARGPSLVESCHAKWQHWIAALIIIIIIIIITMILFRISDAIPVNGCWTTWQNQSRRWKINVLSLEMVRNVRQLWTCFRFYTALHDRSFKEAMLFNIKVSVAYQHSSPTAVTNVEQRTSCQTSGSTTFTWSHAEGHCRRLRSTSDSMHTQHFRGQKFCWCWRKSVEQSPIGSTSAEP